MWNEIICSNDCGLLISVISRIIRILVNVCDLFMYVFSFLLNFQLFMLRVWVMAPTEVKTLFLSLFVLIWLSRMGVSDTVSSSNSTDFYLVCCLVLYSCFGCPFWNCVLKFSFAVQMFNESGIGYSVVSRKEISKGMKLTLRIATLPPRVW